MKHRLPVVLASASPRRFDLLSTIVEPTEIDVRPVDLHEPDYAGSGSAAGDVTNIARAKAALAWSDGELVLAGDTMVVHAGHQLGQPADRSHAREMLLAMAGDVVEVVSAVVLVSRAGARFDEVVTTELHLRSFAEADIDSYLATGAGDDKAGALEVQGRAADFVASTTGCFTNVIGFPLCAVARLLGATTSSACRTSSGGACPEL